VEKNTTKKDLDASFFQNEKKKEIKKRGERGGKAL